MAVHQLEIQRRLGGPSRRLIAADDEVIPVFGLLDVRHHDVGHIHREEGGGLGARALMDSLENDRHGSGQFFRQVDDPGILLGARVRRQHHAKRLDALVLPDVLSVRIDRAGLVLRVDCTADDGNPQVIILDAVAVLGVIQNG